MVKADLKRWNDELVGPILVALAGKVERKPVSHIRLATGERGNGGRGVKAIEKTVL